MEDVQFQAFCDELEKIDMEKESGVALGFGLLKGIGAAAKPLMSAAKAGTAGTQSMGVGNVAKRVWGARGKAIKAFKPAMQKGVEHAKTWAKPGGSFMTQQKQMFKGVSSPAAQTARTTGWKPGQGYSAWG